MKKIWLAVISAVTLSLVAGVASADNLKIGVIDVQQIMQKSSQFAAINAQLTKQFKPRQDKLAAMQKDLQSEVDELNKNSTTMNADERNKLQDKVIADRGNLETASLSFRRDLATQQNQDLQTFMNKLTGVVASIAKSGGYDMILQRNGVPYVNEKFDVTSQVLQQLR
jgi:outer membrane protein